jgi:EAL domain-containing protein (putative c-di-GMP-specific phosphodiesterase class I)
VEALIRWRHPERGLLLPGSFIRAAEQTAVSDDLADWVAQEACRQAREWHDAGLHPTISINVSPDQLRAPAFARRFLDQIERHGLVPSNFGIELIESAWTVDALTTLPVIADLRATGVYLAIDDFGAGYSSLARLRELEFDVLKVDRGLLRDVPADATAIAVLRAILDLARACGSWVVVEGVETEPQRRFLAEHGVDMVQGFHLGRPQPAEQAAPLLARRLLGHKRNSLIGVGT